MTKSFVTLALLASIALGTPVPEAAPEAQLSLPPLIPSIPGVTEPLTSNAPPLPILQLPTPPLASPPFTGSDIKPKIGYFWTGAGDNIHAGTPQSIAEWRYVADLAEDFLAAYSLDDVGTLT